MPSRFALASPPETAFTRRLLLAAEIVDAVTLEPVTRGLKVTATGLRRRPVINVGGFHVWLQDGDLEPRRIVVDADGSPYESAEAEPPAPPERSVRIELAPRFGYPFPPGATALRGTLRARRFGPPVPIAGARVRLQWNDDADWVDAPVVSTSDGNGDFAALLRLARGAEPKPHPDGGVTARLVCDRDGAVRTSAEFPVLQGRVSAREEPFIWEELNL